MTTTNAIAAVRNAMSDGTFDAMRGAVKAAGLSTTYTKPNGETGTILKSGKAMRAALDTWLKAQTVTDTGKPAVQSEPFNGAVDKPVQGADGTVKCYVRSADGQTFANANGVQAMAHAFATVTTEAELVAFLGVAEQLAEQTMRRLGSSPERIAELLKDASVAPKSITETEQRLKDATTTELTPVAPKPEPATHDTATEQPKKPAAKKNVGLAEYHAIKAKAKAMGLPTTGTKDELTARIAAAQTTPPAPKTEQQTVKPDTGFTPKMLNRLTTMADALGIRLGDMVAAAELAGVKLS